MNYLSMLSAINPSIVRMLRQVALVAACMINFATCSMQSKTEEPYINAIKLIYNLPLTTLENQEIVLRNHSDSLFLFYSDSSIVYKFPKVQVDRHNGEIISQKTSYNYLVYNKNDIYGQYFTSPQANDGSKVKVDSLLNRKWRLKVSFLDGYELIKSTKNSYPNNELVEKYICDKKGMQHPDTVILYYTNTLDDVEFSLSDSLDRLKGQKLFKIKCIFNPQIYKDHPFNFPRREVSFSMERFGVTDKVREELDAFF